MNDRSDQFVSALLSIDRLSARRIVDEELSRVSPIDFVETVVIGALERIGAQWQTGDVALSQVYMAGRICEDLVDEILPPADPARKNQPRMAICVLSDHHKLGKVIVYSMLRASGFDLLDYGTMEIDPLIDRVATDNIQILLVSVLILQSALKVKQLRARLAGRDVKIIVGGAPFRFDDHLWREVGADAMCRSASEAEFSHSICQDCAKTIYPEFDIYNDDGNVRDA
ncbi:MAG: cobalamin-dependent protein [Pseudomonadota bacterium]